MLAFISIVLCKGDDGRNSTSESEETAEALPTPEALTLYRVSNKAFPISVLKRADVVVREKREPPIRIRKRRPKPPPQYIRRPPSKPKSKGKPKPKYGPPSFSSNKPLSHYPSQFSDDSYNNHPGSFQGTQGFNALLDTNVYESSLPVIYPAQTFGEPPVIPVATISEVKSSPPKTRYGIPHFSSSLSAGSSGPPKSVFISSSSPHSFDNVISSKYKRPGPRPPSHKYGSPPSASAFPTGISSSSPNFPPSFQSSSNTFHSVSSPNFPSSTSNFPSSPSNFPSGSSNFPSGSSNFPPSSPNFPTSPGGSSSSSGSFPPFQQSGGSKDFIENSNIDFEIKPSAFDSEKYQEPKKPKIPDFPLESGYVKDLYKTTVSSYDVPTYDHGNGAVSFSMSSAKAPTVPKLPNYYDQNEFKTPTRTSNGLQASSANIYDPEDYTAYLNDVSESKKIHVKAKQKYKNSPPTKFEELEKELKSIRIPSEESRDDIKYAFTSRTSPITTTTTKKPRYRRKKKPKVPSNQHNLDTDDLRDAFGDNTDFHEVSLTPDELLDFEPQRKVKHSRPVGVTNPNNYVLLSSQNHNHEESSEEDNGVTEPTRTKIHSTLTRSRIKNANKPNYSSLYPSKSKKSKNSDGVHIVSIEKSKSHSFYGGAVPESEFMKNYGLSRRNDDRQQEINEFSVGTGISFGVPIQQQSNRNSRLGDTITGVWDADYDPLPKNHKFS